MLALETSSDSPDSPVVELRKLGVTKGYGHFQITHDLFSHSEVAVMSPIKDSTGQSRYVDDYLGQADSAPRKRASRHFRQMRGKINSCRTRAEFDELFCEGS